MNNVSIQSTTEDYVNLRKIDVTIAREVLGYKVAYLRNMATGPCILDNNDWYVDHVPHYSKYLSTQLPIFEKLGEEGWAWGFDKTGDSWCVSLDHNTKINCSIVVHAASLAEAFAKAALQISEARKC